MQLDLTAKEFRRLLDLVYIGNWVLNSTRENDRIPDYDLVEEKVFALAAEQGMGSVCENVEGRIYPSRAYEEGGIHEAIAKYEDDIFFDLLAETLARRDLGYPETTDEESYRELTERMEAYLTEFDLHGLDRVTVESDEL